MTKGLLATKVGMTQVFAKDGRKFAATVLHVEPNVVLNVLTKEKDGYNALKLGYKTVKSKSLNKPELGQFKDTGTSPKKFIKEIRNMEGFEKGAKIRVDLFEKGEYINAQARTKGHGFTGSIKRHNFHIGPMGHGAGYPHRYVGSVSGGRGGSQAQRVFKGHPLPGHYGNELVTIQNLLILDINPNLNYIIVKGAIPGPKGQIITLRNSVKFAGKKEEIELVQYRERQELPVVEEVEEVVVYETKPKKEPKVKEVKEAPKAKAEPKAKAAPKAKAKKEETPVVEAAPVVEPTPVVEEPVVVETAPVEEIAQVIAEPVIEEPELTAEQMEGLTEEQIAELKKTISLKMNEAKKAAQKAFENSLNAEMAKVQKDIVDKVVEEGVDINDINVSDAVANAIDVATDKVDAKAESIADKVEATMVEEAEEITNQEENN